MRLLRVTRDALVFQFAPREKGLLLELLRLHPRMPGRREAVSKSGHLPDQAAAQRLLEEALAEQRAQNALQLRKLVSDPRNWILEETHWLFTLAKADLEWTLQVLNDIRVGSWILLGSPEQWSESVKPESARHLWAMELAGAFQMAFLHALEGEEE